VTHPVIACAIRMTVLGATRRLTTRLSASSLLGEPASDARRLTLLPTTDHCQMREHSIKVRRSARYYTLGPDDERTVRDVWFVLHGYGQLAAQFIGIFEAVNDGTRLIVAPEALNRFYVAGVETAPAAERGVGATWMT